MDRICASVRGRIMSAADAAALVGENAAVGCSGFTLVGDPKAVPAEIAKLGRAKGMDLFTGASVCDEVDGVLCRAGMVEHRYPYQSNSSLRTEINCGKVAYADMHLSHMPRFLSHGGREIDFAIVECTAITPDGIIPSAAVGASDCFIRGARRLILEVNEALPIGLCGMHDIYAADGGPIPIRRVTDRIGTVCIPVAWDRVAAVVLTNNPGKCPVFKAPDEDSRAIAGHIVRFLKSEVSAGRQPASLNPLQSGVGSVANAVMAGLSSSGFTGLRMYTEVIQDAAFDLIDRGIMTAASTTAVSLSESAAKRFYGNIETFRDKIVIRPQEIANNPEVIRRLNLIAMNTPIECDIYGNANSTHIMGTKMMNGIGGSGDFARNAGLTIFATSSLAKDGKISCIVPMCSHVDHTEHDVQVIVTEQGLADLRWKSPRERAELIIENCAHPSYRPMLRAYFEEACAKGGHTPHVLSKALSWHTRFLETGTMQEA